MRPNSATMAAAALMVLAASMRLALSGNRPAPAEAVDQAIIANARIHSDSSQRSRRSPSRTRSPVPASVSRILGPPSTGGGLAGGRLPGHRAVVPQEQVLQGRGLAGQGPQAGGRQRLHEWGQTRRFDLGADAVIRHDQVVDPGQGLQARRHDRDVGGDRGPGQVPQLLERAGLHNLAGSDDADPVGQGLGLAEDVAAQQDGAPLVAQLSRAPAEGVLRGCARELRDQGRTILLSSHILSEAEALSDRISIIRAGKVVETGRLDQLRHLTRTSVTARVAVVPPGLESLPGVHDLVVANHRVSAQVEPSGLAPLMQALTAAGLQTLTSQPPTLEDLFLRHYAPATGEMPAGAVASSGGRPDDA